MIGLCLLGLVSAAAARVPAPLSEGERAARCFALAREHGLPPEGVLLVVSVADQRLIVIVAEGVRARYPVSTSKWGTGAGRGSWRTPPGWHRVAERIGAGAPPGQVFVGRQPVAAVLPPSAWRAADGEDLVLTRILWLDGLEPGRNRGGDVDSRSRFIYLHGTHQEHLLGRPASHGCVRLANRDIIELFDLTWGRETFCWITEMPWEAPE